MESHHKDSQFSVMKAIAIRDMIQQMNETFDDVQIFIGRDVLDRRLSGKESIRRVALCVPTHSKQAMERNRVAFAQNAILLNYFFNKLALSKFYFNQGSKESPKVFKK